VAHTAQMRRYMDLMEDDTSKQLSLATQRAAAAKEILAKARQFFILSSGGKVDGEGRLCSKSNVSSRGAEFPTLPVQFGQVGGHFECSGVGLTSLKGAPPHVGGNFYAGMNLVTSLAGGPAYIGGDFKMWHNKLKTLEGGPSHVGDFYDVSGNELTSLKGAATCRIFDCSKNHLTTLDGAPPCRTLGCSENELTSLVGMSDVCETLYADHNPIKTLEGLPAAVKVLHIDWHESIPLLRLVAQGCELWCAHQDTGEVHMVCGIINKHALDKATPARVRMVACQKELIDAGFAGNARM
jgi:hypothetical protein